MLHAEIKLRQVLNCFVEEKFPESTEVIIKPISNDGGSNTSTLFASTIVMPEENLEIFAKVASMGSLTAISNYVFGKEKFVYSTLASAYEKIQDNHGLTSQRFKFAKYYTCSATDATDIILIENLASQGYECYDRLKSITWRYASKSVEMLAKFHALSLGLSKEYPEEFKTAGEALKLPPMTGHEWKGMADGALAAVDGVDREKLSQLLEGSVGWSKVKDFGDPIKTSVIIHRDYRASNLLHKEMNGELHVIPVDYQTARLGCPVADLIYFIVLGTDQQFRRQHYHQLVGHYYQHLALAMTSLGLVLEEVYGREEFESDMKEKLPLGLCVAAIMLPYVTVDPAHAPSFERGRFVPRASELFVERFRELVDDFKQWGFI